MGYESSGSGSLACADRRENNIDSNSTAATDISSPEIHQTSDIGTRDPSWSGPPSSCPKRPPIIEFGQDELLPKCFGPAITVTTASATNALAIPTFDFNIVDTSLLGT